MNILYLHGFKSSPLSLKGQQLSDYCQKNTMHHVECPDLNLAPKDVITQLSAWIEAHSDVVLVGSSLGGFYATQLVAKYAIPAVLINPAMRPWELFGRLFSAEQLPYQVTPTWQLSQAHLDDLAELAVTTVACPEKVLVLLQQHDEILDYREAQGYYSQPEHCAMIMTETQGDHAMQNFAEKIPMLLEFLQHSI